MILPDPFQHDKCLSWRFAYTFKATLIVYQELNSSSVTTCQSSATPRCIGIGRCDSLSYRRAAGKIGLPSPHLPHRHQPQKPPNILHLPSNARPHSL